MTQLLLLFNSQCSNFNKLDRFTKIIIFSFKIENKLVVLN